MSNDTIKYQADLIEHSIAILQDALDDLEKGNELSEVKLYDIMGIVLSQIQDVIDISSATDEANKTEIMNKWR
ncbi:MAG: hypothetical protein M0Q13_02790 [Methanothrix sp.]|jgi:hypothetical protein|nr:hypothetical protein [Methanothrix sp.]